MDVISLDIFKEELDNSDNIYFYKEIKRVRVGNKKTDKMDYTKEKVKLTIKTDKDGKTYLTDLNDDIKYYITEDFVILKSQRNSYVIKGPNSMVFLV